MSDKNKQSSESGEDNNKRQFESEIDESNAPENDGIAFVNDDSDYALSQEYTPETHIGPVNDNNEHFVDASDIMVIEEIPFDRSNSGCDGNHALEENNLEDIFYEFPDDFDDNTAAVFSSYPSSELTTLVIDEHDRSTTANLIAGNKVPKLTAVDSVKQRSSGILSGRDAKNAALQSDELVSKDNMTDLTDVEDAANDNETFQSAEESTSDERAHDRFLEQPWPVNLPDPTLTDEDFDEELDLMEEKLVEFDADVEDNIIDNAFLSESNETLAEMNDNPQAAGSSLQSDIDSVVPQSLESNFEEFINPGELRKIISAISPEAYEEYTIRYRKESEAVNVVNPRQVEEALQGMSGLNVPLVRVNDTKGPNVEPQSNMPPSTRDAQIHTQDDSQTIIEIPEMDDYVMIDAVMEDNTQDTPLNAASSSVSDRSMKKKNGKKSKPMKEKSNVTRKHNRCAVCKARLGLCAVSCRCGNLYCNKHISHLKHGCTYDYKAMGKEEIRKNNPRIVAEKVRKL